MREESQGSKAVGKLASLRDKSGSVLPRMVSPNNLTPYLSTRAGLTTGNLSRNHADFLRDGTFFVIFRSNPTSRVAYSRATVHAPESSEGVGWPAKWAWTAAVT
jgi:hypothetical protein